MALPRAEFLKILTHPFPSYADLHLNVVRLSRSGNCPIMIQYPDLGLAFTLVIKEKRGLRKGHRGTY